MVEPVEHKLDETNTCERCGKDFKDADVHIIDGEGAVCLNCLGKEKPIDEDMAETDEDIAETIDEVFNDMLTDAMTEDEFWDWVRDWKDVNSIIEETENWRNQAKLDDIAYYLAHRRKVDDWTKRAEAVLRVGKPDE